MTYAIEAFNISKKIGDKAILSNISLLIPRGVVYGFLGANGAGKTSFMKILMGLWRTDSGTIRLLDKELKGGDAVYRSVGSIIEAPIFYQESTARRNLELHRDYLLGVEPGRINQVLAMVGLLEDSDKPVREYSLGMKQRLAISRALLGRPELLILDEPLNGLDPHGIRFFRELVKEINEKEGTTIIVSSHILDEVAKVANTIGIISGGRMVAEIPMQSIGDNLGDLEETYFSIVQGKGA
ncbi:MAG: ATP-binding cassette domain-containing protein [Puniceicoccales bacterium]|jgi:ABC-2 type transport system ATP-binding protein|nr:ATP-binding cassette domain-containing protein [Puniceicoccales bacterium]